MSTTSNSPANHEGLKDRSSEHTGEADEMDRSGQLLNQIIAAVLYEGYILYPYRASSRKNQRERFTFGRVYPRIYSESQNGAEPCVIQAECLVERLNDTPNLEVTFGFLQPVLRQVCRSTGLETERVAQLEIEGRLYQTWMEAIERKVTVTLDLASREKEIPFSFAAAANCEPIADREGRPGGAIRRTKELLKGMVSVKAESLGENLFKLSARIVNESPLSKQMLKVQEEVLRRCFASTHIVFHVDGGHFISLLDPPVDFKAFAQGCQNHGVWPVLVGDEDRNERNTMLASPIILYDYPKIAPESRGSFFDGTEIDEMLTLRVLTMTDGEKREMRLDEFSRRILERTHNLDPENFLKLHGRMRQTNASNGVDSQQELFNPATPVKSAWVDGVELKAGDRVSICPKRRADAMDMMLAGRTALIEALEQDAEMNVHLALVLEDDPGRDMGLARQSGHRFFYGLDEVKAMKPEAAA